MQDELPIQDVSDTSFWVAYYRAKETERPDALFKDPLAKVLIGERGKQISESMGEVSRYTEWSVVSRTVIIDRFIQKWIDEGADAVVNLGAGMDTRPYRMPLPPGLQWVEVDYPNIINHKNKILKNEKPGCQLKRISANLADGDIRKALFKTIVPSAKKVLVLTEGVIPYLNPLQVSELAKDLRDEERFQYWITEYFHPKVYPYLQRAVRTAKMKNAPFQFFPENWFGFFKAAGWTEKETRYAGEIAKESGRQPPMPFIFKLIFPLLPQKVKEESGRMMGYTTLQKN